MASIQMRVEHLSSQAANATDNMWQMIASICAQSDRHETSSDSPRALARRALYAEHGSNEGSVDYERRLGAQARFEHPHFSEHMRARDSEGRTSTPLTYVGAEEKMSTGTSTPSIYKRTRGNDNPDLGPQE